MYDVIFQLRDQKVNEQTKQGQPSTLEKYAEANTKYQRDLAAVGVKPSREQLYGRPFKA